MGDLISFLLQKIGLNVLRVALAVTMILGFFTVLWGFYVAGMNAFSLLRSYWDIFQSQYSNLATLSDLALGLLSCSGVIDGLNSGLPYLTGALFLLLSSAVSLFFVKVYNIVLSKVISLIF